MYLSYYDKGKFKYSDSFSVVDSVLNIDLWVPKTTYIYTLEPELDRVSTFRW